jgi:hypothetical protein
MKQDVWPVYPDVALHLLSGSLWSIMPCLPALLSISINTREESDKVRAIRTGLSGVLFAVLASAIGSC